MKKKNIAVLGLGYVGLPLLVEFSKYYNVIGYDINIEKINDLKKNKNIKKRKIILTNNINNLFFCNIYIIAVPTPIFSNKKPDLRPLKKACTSVSKLLNKDDLIIFESTVYPGLTEEICVPLLEKYSLLKYNLDFICGYSPERINPGDSKHLLTDIVKITSGSNAYAAKIVDNLYKKIIKAGTYKAPSIKVAEAAKVIENAQRDLNIAFVNELSIIFHKMNINTNDVLKAALTKWNFLNFTPGLVGGHCIGVDPYYLTYKSKKKGYDPKVILSGRRLNDSMAKFLLIKLKEEMKIKNINYINSKYLIMGATFKENCDDIRNSKVFDLVNILRKKNKVIHIFEPNIKNVSLLKNNGYTFVKYPRLNFYDVIIISVSHDIFKKIGKKTIISFAKSKKIIFDVKNLFNDDKNFLKI